jgi:zinc transporter ZupT
MSEMARHTLVNVGFPRDIEWKRRTFRGTVKAFAAGAILALVSETMIPEAFHGTPQFNGLLLVVGFVALLILLVLSH